MTSSYRTKKLIVEGEQDKRVIPYLMEANGIIWEKDKHPVEIENYGGDGFINPYRISARLKGAGLTHLGLMVDADDDPDIRWRSIRNACLPSIPDIPEQIPEIGLLLTTNGIKFGVWIMPDNLMRGMLETFLAYMIRDESELLWQYAQEVVAEAKNRGAPFIDSHIDKAYIYTWLAWQKPPGRQLHNAIKEEILNPQHPKAQTFVTWFKTLYDL
ncbi:hypothetical protein LC608_14380 [Nostoc sp. XA010]|uniref:DUF3226 domain-containing protein n=1 Tax=Nostoc sp. XA010 TaxID=2780407 RepID=UPI001E410DAF|nr:DUF3226 domain-containing protein [Nostoc sp. XA010]MCC5658156.1 hypothetical protein [Nostoc sp. XA010]